MGLDKPSPQTPLPLCPTSNISNENFESDCSRERGFFGVFAFTVAQKRYSDQMGIRQKKRWQKKSGKLGFARLLRADMTPMEKVLWKALRNRQFHHLKFRRQAPLENYIVDFFCRQRNLIIEIDGGIHRVKKEYDAVRQNDLEAKGYHILRFTNEEVESSLPHVLRVIAKATNKQ